MAGASQAMTGAAQVRTCDDFVFTRASRLRRPRPWPPPHPHCRSHSTAISFLELFQSASRPLHVQKSKADIMFLSSASRRRFSDLSEAEILALAISSEEDDARIYATYAEQLRADYPASAAMFDAM